MPYRTSCLRDDPLFACRDPESADPADTTGWIPPVAGKVTMKSVYEASSGLDAHMILNLLEQHGISGRVEGEYLQGGIGELQAMGFVRVLVSEQDCAEARKIIGEWESIQPEEEGCRPEARPSGGIRIFVAGVIVGAGIMYWILKVAAA